VVELVVEDVEVDEEEVVELDVVELDEELDEVVVEDEEVVDELDVVVVVSATLFPANDHPISSMSASAELGATMVSTSPCVNVVPAPSKAAIVAAASKVAVPNSASSF